MKFSFPIPGALLLISGLWISGTARAQDTFQTYRNARYGTTVSYPSNLVTPQPESQSGDGRKFLSRDGQIELTIYAFRNGSRRSAKGEMNRAIRDWKRDTARLTYARSSSSWFVLSGYLGDDIFYEKTLLRNGIFHTLIWQYPKTLKKRLNASVTRSALSFSARKSSEEIKTPTISSAQPTPQPSPTSRPRRTPRTSSSGY